MTQSLKGRVRVGNNEVLEEIEAVKEKICLWFRVQSPIPVRPAPQSRC